jgi:transposase-like protein
MTCHTQHSEAESAAQLIAERGLEGLGDAVSLLINEAMRLERELHLGVSPFERSPARRGYANGYKPKTVKSRVGALELAVPQVREGGFYPQSLDKGLRSERALKLALAEMVVTGVSTRKIARVTQELCGFEVSSSEVSRCAAELDDELAAWRERPLGAYPYVVLDARYEKMRHGGSVVDCAVLLAMGVNPDGQRELLGVSVALSEAEVHWRGFCRIWPHAACTARSCSCPITMLGSRPHVPPYSRACLGSDASFIFSRTPATMCQKNHSRRAWPPTYARSSTPRMPSRPNACSSAS